LLPFSAFEESMTGKVSDAARGMQCMCIVEREDGAKVKLWVDISPHEVGPFPIGRVL
jgi:hypothetical protein